MQNKKVLSLVLATFLSLGLGLNSALAASTNFEYLKEKRPYYLGIKIGKFEGCESPTTCKKEKYQGSVEVTHGKVTLSKEILIDSAEKLSNELNDTGVPASKIDFGFETEFYKGLIVKLYLDENFTLEDTLTLKLKRGDEAEMEWVIPYDLITKKTLDVLYTSADIDPIYESWRADSEWVKVMPLYYGSDNDRVPAEFAKRLEILNKLISLERFARAEYLAGRLDIIHYLELQKIWDFFWGGTRVTDLEVAIFSKRYGRLKKMLNEGSTSLARVIGNLRLYTERIKDQYETVWYNLD